MTNRDAILHVRGESRYVDDRLTPEDTLFGAVVTSDVACGTIRSVDTSPAESREGVVCVLTAGDPPGENQIGNIIRDEPLFADSEVHYIGQPIALVVARDAATARSVARGVKVEIDPGTPLLDPREAHAQGSLIAPPRTFALGDIEAAWDRCKWIVEGRVESGGQEHVYLETQGTVAWPAEDGKVVVQSATQSPSVVQCIVARMLGMPMQRVEVDVLRLGGAFGGKEDQATAWAAMAALAAWKTGKAVKVVLRRREDMRSTGKRHPYSSDFRIGLGKDLDILAYDVTFYQNAGAAADLSTSILERTLFHATNSYNIPNVRATAVSCRTNLPPNTAFRGFGAPQAMFVMECAVRKAAAAAGAEAEWVQRKNLLSVGDEFPYGMRCSSPNARRSWEMLEDQPETAVMREAVSVFNAEHALRKKGLAFMPVCFGVSFTTTFLNQAGALVHVYSDGSVGVSTAAVEMGQGVNTKIRQAAARTFSIGLDRVRVETTNTARVANTSPTAASSAADLNGNATRLACEAILQRLVRSAADLLGSEAPDDISLLDETVQASGQATDLKWEALVQHTYRNRISLSAQAHYATPRIHFDKAVEKGEPFSYHVAGTAVTEVTLDCLRGTYEVDAVRVVHDLGRSINPMIDLGQMEGGLVQGIGWVTLEELLYDDEGRLLTDSMSTYKIPDMNFAPGEIQAEFIQDAQYEGGAFGSKAIGEPPFMYGIGTFFALVEAMRAFRPDLPDQHILPLTPERVLMELVADLSS
ncbi:MAG: molybdopterin-dependent oxidoreductase [Kiritimatiellia bacterium]|jgi:xanthine dehydrogenase large subunit|nr:molybdopterin-dependent oxidoreductase [Kiritimatiellia bacterium]MDP6631768.1 molybdopterin-dependent oxidoreductase [Kiritimatiellia bacterium]MDP6810478.1 molybdopterin-dependent oxidoreductase [Kiritimatiellia bacterium]MDP7025004.1 molybdopterin-dependent oxidoreductase [Kiritimatiellia bacterium]